MSLQKITFKAILLFGILATFTSCKGQNNKSAHGKSLAELHEKIWVIYQDQENKYWFGSNGEGVFHYDDKGLSQLTEENGLVSNQIRGIQEDKLGNIYFDTPKGVSKFNGLTFTTLNPVYSAKNEWKSELDDLWFKGNGDINGVYRYDGKQLFHLEFPEYDLEGVYGVEVNETYSPYGVYSIYKDNEGNIWFGTLSAGVYRYDGKSLWIAEKELMVLDDGRVPGVRSIIEDKDGNFWLSNILSRYKVYKEDASSKEKYEKLEGIEARIGQDSMYFPYFMSAVTDDENKDLWMVTYEEGVWRYDGENLFNYQVKSDGKKVLLFSIYKDNQGTLWLGTHNAGVLKFNGKTFEKFEPR